MAERVESEQTAGKRHQLVARVAHEAGRLIIRKSPQPLAAGLAKTYNHLALPKHWEAVGAGAEHLVIQRVLGEVTKISGWPLDYNAGRESATEVLQRHYERTIADYELVQRYFGDLVIPQAINIDEVPYRGTRYKSVIIKQPEVPVLHDLFNLNYLRLYQFINSSPQFKEDISSLFAGTQALYQDLECLPDFTGSTNFVVYHPAPGKGLPPASKPISLTEYRIGILDTRLWTPAMIKLESECQGFDQEDALWQRHADLYETYERVSSNL